jgi:hypothetical protein
VLVDGKRKPLLRRLALENAEAPTTKGEARIAGKAILARI